MKLVKWVIREYVYVHKTACPWLIRKFTDPQAEFIFAPAEKTDVISNKGAIPFDVPKAELENYDGECSLTCAKYCLR